MNRITAPPLKKPTAALFLAAVILCVLPSALASPLATIDLIPASSGRALSTGNAAFNETSGGINNVPLGTKVFMQALPTTTALSGYRWRLMSQPAGSTATLSATSATMVTLRPDKVGEYQVVLVPQSLAGKATTATVQLIHASTWVGVGTINTHSTPHPVAPNCGTGFCHGGFNATAALNVLSTWQTSGHSTKMIRDLSGQAPTYQARCLPCHSAGYNTTSTAVNNGMDDIAAAIKYDLTTQIPLLAQAAAAEQLSHFGDLPAQIQSMANIQCENCHGPGSQHPSHLADPDHRIGGVDLSSKACAQCHDAPSHHMNWYQWSHSAHPAINTMEDYETSERSTCSMCHSGNGFVDTRINGKPTVGYDKSISVGATCTTCHNPHGSPYPHQLRISGDFTFPSGQSYMQVTGMDPGVGGMCMRCHNSRVVSVATSMNSFRGAHHGPQGDILAGINAYDFGQPFAANSAHTTSATETCVTCHMATAPSGGNTPPIAGGHTMMLVDDKGTTSTADDYDNAVNACGACHPGLTTVNRTARADYDGNGKVEGIQTEVKGLLSLIKTEIIARFPKGTIDPETGKVSFSSTDYSKLTTTQKGVIYNYNMIIDDASFGVHNTSYIVQILQRSYTNLVGQPVPGGVVRAPYKGSNKADNWAVYE